MRIPQVAARALFLLSACADHEVKVECYSSGGHVITEAETHVIQTIADATAIELHRLLPALPRPLVIKVQLGRGVIPETGENGTWLAPNVVYWTVDPDHEGGLEGVAKTQLRWTLFHELHHLVRGQTIERETLMDAVIAEGLATAFERDAGAPAPWGQYTPEVAAWVDELLALPSDAPREQWLFKHPDGRRWIGFKVGTLLVDRAARASGQSAAALVSTPTLKIIELGLGSLK